MHSKSYAYYVNTGIHQDNKNITEIDDKIHITIVKLQIKIKKNIWVYNYKERCKNKTC